MICSFLWKGEPRSLCGVIMDPLKFIPLYLMRFVERRDLDGDLTFAGHYKIKIKVHLKNIQSVTYFYATHGLRDELNPLMFYVLPFV